jgi:hypothetical protein
MCIYYKQLHATVTLNTTLASFENRTGTVRSTFISGMAAAAGVAPDQVHIHFAVIRLNQRRHLVTPSYLNNGDGRGQIIQVSVTVTGSESLQRVPQCLEGMHLSHSWEIQRRLLVLTAPSNKPSPLANDWNT